jgi:DNA-binding MarR family transcriptional regulator
MKDDSPGFISVRDGEDPVSKVAELWSSLIGQAILFNERVARTVGMSAVDLQTFGVISRHDGPITPTEVMARTGLPASTITRVLDRLEQSGYVARRNVHSDRRKVAVEVIPAMATKIAHHYIGKIEQIRDLNARRTQAEVATVIAYLRDLANLDEV